jgi:hypothetical protein
LRRSKGACIWGWSLEAMPFWACAPPVWSTLWSPPNPLLDKGQGVIMAQTTPPRILSNGLTHASMCMWWIINLSEFGKNLLMPDMQRLGRPTSKCPVAFWPPSASPLVTVYKASLMGNHWGCSNPRQDLKHQKTIPLERNPVIPMHSYIRNTSTIIQKDSTRLPKNRIL